MLCIAQRYNENINNTILSNSYALMAEIAYIGTSNCRSLVVSRLIDTVLPQLSRF